MSGRRGVGALGEALKPRDAWWTVIVVDPVAVAILPALTRSRWVTPLGISLLALGVGVASVLAFATGALAGGAVLVQSRFFLDCLDGKLARVRGSATAWGAFVDLASDTLVLGAAYAALGFWMAAELVPGAWLTLVLLPAFATSSWLHLYRRLALGDATRSPLTSDAPRRVWSWSRLHPYPGAVEAEMLVLFLFPLLMPIGWFPYVVAIASAFYVFSAVDSAVRIRTRLRSAERPVVP